MSFYPHNHPSMISRSLGVSLMGSLLTASLSFFVAGTVLADAAPPPTEVVVRFMQNNEAVMGPVDFTLTCSVLADANPLSDRSVTIDIPGHCTGANCRIDGTEVSQYLEGKDHLMNDCSIKGILGGAPFEAQHVLIQKPDRLTCDSNYDMLVGDSTGMNYYLFTRAYNDCMTSVRQKYFPGSGVNFTCNAYRKLVKVCSPTGRCLSIDNKLYEETPASQACIQREMDEEHACLALAINVTGTLDKNANGEPYETVCQALINLPASVRAPAMAASSTALVMPVNATTSMDTTIDTNAMNVVSMPVATPVVERSFFGRVFDRISCFFVHVFGGICVGEAR